MNVIVCICDNGGMLFNNRRQSSDKGLLINLSELIVDEALYISDFSERLFEESPICTIASSAPLEFAGEGDFVFIENAHISDYKNKIESLIIYKWNRVYPFSFSLDLSPEKEGMMLEESIDFKGSSHEKITREIWRNKK